MINFFKKFCDKLFRKKRYKYVKVIEGSATTKAEKDTITIIKKNGSYSWAKLYCPCGCGREIALSLNKSIKPSWTIMLDKDGKVSFSPSIYVTGSPCKAHFYLNNNNIKWV